MRGRKPKRGMKREPNGRISRTEKKLAADMQRPIEDRREPPSQFLMVKKAAAMNGRTDLELDDPMAELHAHGLISDIAFSASARFALTYWRVYGRPFADTAKIAAFQSITGGAGSRFTQDEIDEMDLKKEQAMKAMLDVMRRFRVQWQVIELAAYRKPGNMLHILKRGEKLNENDLDTCRRIDQALKAMP